MPHKSLRPRQGEEASDSSGQTTPEGTNTESDMMTSIMDAIKKSEQNVLERIESVTCEIHKKMDILSAELQDSIASVRTDLAASIASNRDVITAHGTRLDDLEGAANAYSDRVTELEGKFVALTSETNKLRDKAEDLESRQRRENCRIFGIEENFGNTRPEQAIAQLLKDSLKLDYTPTLDRAHRSLQQKPKSGDPPRPFMVRFHYFQEKADVLRKAARAGPILHSGRRIHIYPDYTAKIAKQRAAFKDVRGLLHRCRGVKFGILYPATLKITTTTGDQKTFVDPDKAKEYILGHLQPQDGEEKV